MMSLRVLVSVGLVSMVANSFLIITPKVAKFQRWAEAESMAQELSLSAETYIQCGKCKSVYEMSVETLGKGKKVQCSVCDHSWWQGRERLQELREGWQFAELPTTRIDEVRDNISAGREPAEEKPKKKGAVTVFVGNLPYYYGVSEIEEIFAAHGEVASVTVVKQPDGQSKGYAFVDMVDKSAGEKAISELDGSPLLGRNLHVALGGGRK